MQGRFGMPFLLETNTIAEAAALCEEQGLSFIELNLNIPACQTDVLDVQELYYLKEKHGIYFTLHMEEDFDPFSFNPAVRRAWMDSLRRTLTIAQAIDAPVVNMHLAKGIYITLPEERVYLFERYADEYARAVAELRYIVEQELEGSNVRLCIENTNGFAQHEQTALKTLLKSSVFGLTLDIGHSHTIGDTDIPFYEAMNDKLMHMHAHDALGKSNHLALGNGEIDLKQRLAWAEQQNARVVLETKTIQALRTSVSWLEKNIDFFQNRC